MRPTAEQVGTPAVTVPDSSGVDSLVELCRHRARSHPDTVPYIHMADGKEETSRLSYRDLDAIARGIGSRLASETSRGDRVVLVYPPGLDFVAAFFGCLYAGVIAVPAPLPGSDRKGAKSDRVRSLIENAGARLVLTNDVYEDSVRQRLPPGGGFEAVQVISTSDLRADPGDTWAPAVVGPDDIAYLQYSSGSTGSPKGVVLRHGAVLANLGVIHEACQVEVGDRLVGWLPHFHDMGLISSVLQPMFSNGTAWTMPARTVVQRPALWLTAISRCRATVSVAPNFAYDMCVKRVGDEYAKHLDLSSWRTALCGAEPIRAEVLQRFADRFDAVGFRRSAFFPCYGLAESTLMATGGPSDGGMIVGEFDADQITRNRLEPGTGRRLVASGELLDEPLVRVVDPDTLEPVEAGRIGEICIAGASVCSGYWQNASATDDAFDPRLPLLGGHRAMRTGDMGCVHDGQLYVTGRRKDMIIVDGQNHYPQDLEYTASASHRSIVEGGCAAFSVDDGTRERVVVIVEVTRRNGLSRRDDDEDGEVVSAVRSSIAEEHGLRVEEVRVADRFMIPLTSSGKVQRFACKERFLAGEFDGSAARRPRRQALAR